MTVNSQLKEIKTQLRLSMNGSASASMREKGLKYKLNFGVELPRIKQIASQLDKNHDLAQALWKEDIRECKILAGLLQPIDTFFPEIMDIWIEAMPTVEIAEMTCMHLFQHLPYAPQKSLQLIMVWLPVLNLVQLPLKPVKNTSMMALLPLTLLDQPQLLNYTGKMLITLPRMVGGAQPLKDIHQSMLEIVVMPLMRSALLT